MINIVIDTNIYRKSPHRSDLPFQALAQLSKAGVLRLHLPYVVEREFQTQRRSLYHAEIDSAKKALNSILKKGLSATNSKWTQDLLDQIEQQTKSILDDAENSLIAWAEDIGAERQELTIEQSKKALEAYFQGTSPLTEPKKRDDIPDSFIFQAIESISKDIPLVVISEDGKVATASETLKNTTAFRSLATFIESGPIQALIIDLDISDKLPSIIDAIESFEKETNEISSIIRSAIGEAIMHHTIKSPAIPDDNHEATIAGYDEADDVKLEFENLNYFGNGDLGLPFSLTISVVADFYIYKADYFGMDMDLSVSDHNDHYFEAQEEFSLSVSGLAKISIPVATLKVLTADSAGDSLEVVIDSIEDIEVN